MKVRGGHGAKGILGRRAPWVLAVLVLVVAAGSFVAVRHLASQRTGRFCTLAGVIGPTFDTPEEAFADWWAGQDPAQLALGYGRSRDDLPPPPTAADFERDGRNYRWYPYEDHARWLQVDIDHPRADGEQTSDGWTVVGANRCERVTNPAAT